MKRCAPRLLVVDSRVCASSLDSDYEGPVPSGTVVGRFTVRLMNLAVPILVVLLFCSGCSYAIYNTGRFHGVLQLDKKRTEIRGALGSPIRSGEDQSFGPYDEFVVAGPVYNATISAESDMLAAMTLGFSEFLAVPQAVWWKVFCRGPEDVKVFYRDGVHYSWSNVNPAPKVAKTP